MVKKLKNGLPPIKVKFKSGNAEGSNQLYAKAVREMVEKILPEDFFMKMESERTLQDQINYFDKTLPLVSWSSLEEGNFSCFLLSRHRPNAFKFLFEMISRWLVPGKRLDVVLFFAADFYFTHFKANEYTVCEINMHISCKEDLELVWQNLSVIETELRLGVASVYHAQRILDIKGLSFDEKTRVVQEQIMALIHSRPRDFDHELLTEMQHFLVVCRNSFKLIRESRHICRMICVNYLFRRALRESVREMPEKRHLYIKCLRTRLHLPFGLKKVLGVLVGINFLKSNELLEERHLLKAIKTYVSNINVVEDSFFTNTSRTDTIHTMYLEVSKTDGSDFSLDEIKLLRKELPNDLKNRIEHLMHPIFMPYNEEEVMRNILTLGNQLKYLRDIPQVVISFDEQSDKHIFFIVILLRVLKPNAMSIHEMFEKSNSPLLYIPDRVKIVGCLRKKYAKEATVFKVRLEMASFLRGDHSLDLYRARQAVVAELSIVVGEVRDYNGGMISKQHELFCNLKDCLADVAKQNEFLLENFFYSLTPVVMRTILELEPLKSLFLMLLDALKADFLKSENYFLKMQRDENFVLVMIAAADPSFKDEVCLATKETSLPKIDLATTFINVYDTPCLGYIFRSNENKERTLFEDVIKNALKNWKSKKNSMFPDEACSALGTV